MAGTDPFEQSRQLNEHLRNLLNPPALRRLQEIQRAQTRIRDLMDPPALRQLRQVQEAQERIRDLMDPPALRQLRQIQETQERLRELMIGPPAAQQLRQLQEQQARMQALFENPVVRSLREQRSEWDDALTPEVVADIDSFQADLTSRVVSAAEAEAEETGTAPAEESGGVWFGAASWAALLAEIEGLLKALEVMTAAMTGSQMALHAPIPTAILALLIVLCSASEFALWLARQGLDE